MVLWVLFGTGPSHNKTSFWLKSLAKEGRANEGIFLFHIRDHKNFSNRDYVIKFTKPIEAQKLWALENSILAHPEKLIESGKFHKEDLKNLPRFTHIIASSTFERNGETECLIVLEAAKGILFLELIRQIQSGIVSEEAAKSYYFQIGKKMGAQHFYFSEDLSLKDFSQIKTYQHRDLHPGNSFYDPDTQEWTLIDLGGSRKNGIRGVKQDLYQSSMFFSERRIFHENGIIEQKSSISSFPHTKGYTRYNQGLDLSLSFFKGYISIFPSVLHSSVKEFIRKNYQSEFSKFISNLQKGLDHPFSSIEKEKILKKYPFLKQGIAGEF